MLLLATLATITASQALISAVFSVVGASYASRLFGMPNSGHMHCVVPREACVLFDFAFLLY